ncbi:MAG: hypothetical protein J6S13_06005 [Clostridia bacterium]|nr:hypothetical protein [Clostridia bacterium]
MRDYDSCNLCQRSGCTFAVPGVLAVLLFAVIGLLVGAAISAIILANIAAFIVLAVVLAVALGIWAIVRFCRCRCQRD